MPTLPAPIAPEIDLDGIADAGIRALVPAVLNQAEGLRSANRALEAEVERLREQVLRLKGEHASRRKGGKAGKGGGGAVSTGTGVSPPAAAAGPRATAAPGRSSETRRRERGPGRGRSKRRRRADLPVGRQERVLVPRCGLPADVVSKGFEPFLVQELVLRRGNVVYLREKLYSQSTGRT